MNNNNAIDFCTNCRKETAYILRTEKQHMSIKEKDYEFDIKSAVCSECGAYMDVPGLLDYNTESIDKQYRQCERLATIDDIEKVMSIYNIGKAPLSYALGFGEITITRYLMGQIPSKEYSDIIKRALAYPKYMMELLNKNSEKVGATAFKKSMKVAIEVNKLFLISDKLLLTISYVFEQMKEVTPLALQKILYYIQGIYMVMFDKPLFEEDCQAWVHGPVYEKVYELFKDFKYNPIEDNRFAIFKERFIELSEDEKNVINLVVNSFGVYSGKVLEKITHKETPWREARGAFEELQPSNKVISKNSIKAYFEVVAEKYGVDTEEKLHRYIMDNWN